MRPHRRAMDPTSVLLSQLRPRFSRPQRPAQLRLQALVLALSSPTTVRVLTRHQKPLHPDAALVQMASTPSPRSTTRLSRRTPNLRRSSSAHPLLPHRLAPSHAQRVDPFRAARRSTRSSSLTTSRFVRLEASRLLEGARAPCRRTALRALSHCRVLRSPRQARACGILMCWLRSRQLATGPAPRSLPALLRRQRRKGPPILQTRQLPHATRSTTIPRLPPR